MNRYAIHCLDHTDALPRRLTNYEAHKAYLASATVKTIVSGPLLAADGDTMIGSLFIVDAEDRAAVESFHRSDPFSRAGVWKDVSISVFRMRVDNRGDPVDV